ncbi:MAG: phospho-N-acetylmuramoyl-pentapeptide-transferase [Candidatus Sericytochromatia bacterium]
MTNLLFTYQIYILLGLISTLIICPYVINTLKKFKARQTLRLEGPSEHKVKEGTPTMGGIAIFIPIFILSLFFCNFSQEIIVLLLTILGFFLVGFIDDILIVIKGKNDGLRPKLKLVLQMLVSGLFGLYLVNTGHGTYLNIPFTSNSIDISVFYIPFIIFVMTGTSNAINLTDGLDGLAAGTTAISLLPLIIMLTSNDPMYIAGMTTGLVCIGTCLGFLWFNSYPASVFMGDTGSLALGGLVSSLAIISHNALWLPLAGFIFVIETLSVIIQVSYYKRTKKRIFLMSPLHHHFEKKGWRETKVSFRFYIIAFISSMITISGYLLTSSIPNYLNTTTSIQESVK